MVLARGPDHPDGNLDDRLDLQVHLTPQGLLDTTAWETGQTVWLTSRHRSDQPQAGWRIGQARGWVGDPQFGPR